MDTPDFFVGARLGAARMKAGISLEKAAKDTRIRVQRLREIEADDFSGFAHPTYARLFLLDYAEYLDVPQDEIRPLLPDRAGAAGSGFQYIEALSRDPSSPVVPSRQRRPRFLWIFIFAGFFVLIAFAAIFTYFTIKKLERVARSAPLSATANLTETPAPTASPAPVPEEPVSQQSEEQPPAEPSPVPPATVEPAFDPAVSPASGTDTPAASTP